MAAELCAMSAAMDERWQECSDGVQTFPIADDWMLRPGGGVENISIIMEMFYFKTNIKNNRSFISESN